MNAVQNVVEMRSRFATHRRHQQLRGLPPKRVQIDKYAWREVLEAARMREVVDALVRNRYHTVLRGTDGEGNKWMVSATPASYDAAAHEILWECAGRVPLNVVCTAEIEGYNSIYEIEIGAGEMRGELFAAKLPEQLVQVRRRRVRRVEAPEGAQVTFVHPLWPDERVTRSMRDFSGEGVSFFAEIEDVLHSGTVLSNVELSFPGCPPFVMDLTIRQIGKGMTQPFYGAEVKTDDAKMMAAWREHAIRVVHPRIGRGSRYNAQIWDLYQRAGYFGLSAKVPEQFEKLKAPFERVVAGLEQNPELGVHSVWTNERGEAECTLAGLKTYGSSWLLFQLAKVSGKTSDGCTSRQVLRDVNEAVLEHAQQFDKSLRWFALLLQVKKVWSRAAYWDVPMRLAREGKACIVRNHVFEVSTTEWSPAASDEAFEVGPATQAEVMALATQLEETRNAPYREGQDLTRWTMDMGAIRSAWGRAGFSRERHYLAARKDGRVVAVAVLESADEGMHLFRLLDNARVFSLADGGERAFTSLVRDAQEWFRARGRAAFILFLEEDRAKPAPEALAGMSDLGQADLIIFAAEHMTEQLEFVHEFTAPRANE